VRVSGREGAPASPRTRSAPGSGFVSEDRKLDGHRARLSVRENLTLALMPQLARGGVVDEAAAAPSSSASSRARHQVRGPEQPIRELSAATSRRFCSPAGCA
jgi:ribose transport system ATP-binding protein